MDCAILSSFEGVNIWLSYVTSSRGVSLLGRDVRLFILVLLILVNEGYVHYGKKKIMFLYLYKFLIEIQNCNFIRFLLI